MRLPSANIGIGDGAVRYAHFGRCSTLCGRVYQVRERCERMNGLGVLVWGPRIRLEIKIHKVARQEWVPRRSGEGVFLLDRVVQSKVQFWFRRWLRLMMIFEFSKEKREEYEYEAIGDGRNALRRSG